MAKGNDGATFDIRVADPNEATKYTMHAQSLLNSGSSVDGILLELRRLGARQADCTRVLVDVVGMQFPEAKTTVVQSSAWADLRDSTEALQEELFESVEALTHND